MRLKKMVLGALGGLAIAAGSAFLPAREAAAEEGWDCYTIRHGSECGCPTCWLNNCQCSGGAPIVDNVPG